MARFETIASGWIARRTPQEEGRIGGPSCVAMCDGTLISTYITQSAMGVNDFVPHLVRSQDHGGTWQDAAPIWPHLADDWSILVTISRDIHGHLYLFGSRCSIDTPGESFWCDTTQGLKQNELVWSRSEDGGAAWSEPATIPMPVPGAAEAPSPMCVSRSGRWLACYSPYHTFDSALEVDRSQAVILFSDDRGSSWQHTAMLRYHEPDTGCAVAAVTELSEGGFLGASWHLHLADKQPYPNGFAVSDDGGRWQTTSSTGIMGQSVGLAPLTDGRVLMSYTQRKPGPAGFGLAIARPRDGDFGLEDHEMVWHADTVAGCGSGDHSQWTDFAFGMPMLTPLDHDEVLLTFWLQHVEGRGLRYLRLKMNRSS